MPNESRIMKIVRKVSLHLFVSHIWIESTVNESHWFVPRCIFCWFQQMLANIIISNSILLNTNNRYQSSVFVTSGRNKVLPEVTVSIMGTVNKIHEEYLYFRPEIVRDTVRHYQKNLVENCKGASLRIPYPSGCFNDFVKISLQKIKLKFVWLYVY